MQLYEKGTPLKLFAATGSCVPLAAARLPAAKRQREVPIDDRRDFAPAFSRQHLKREVVGSIAVGGGVGLLPGACDDASVSSSSYVACSGESPCSQAPPFLSHGVDFSLVDEGAGFALPEKRALADVNASPKSLGFFLPV